MKKRILCIVLAALNTACTSWPEDGKGGWAESYHTTNAEIEDPWYGEYPHHIHSEFDHLAIKLDWLKTRGIKNCMPAQLYKAELMRNRIKRTIAAEMWSDAEADLRVFYHQLNQLDNHFENIIRQTQCIVTDTTPDNGMLTRLQDLLNSDNQFAHDQDQVTPKYMTRLAQAAELLKLTPETQVLLVGHADANGGEIDNYELAYRRAEQVKHWLTMYGVKPQQLITITQGDKQPYAEQLPSTEVTRHSDRRVNAYVLAGKLNSMQQDMSRVKPLTEWTDKLQGEQEQ